MKGTIDPSINIENRNFPMLPEKYDLFVDDLTEQEAKTFLKNYIADMLRRLREMQTNAKLAVIKEENKMIVNLP